MGPLAAMPSGWKPSGNAIRLGRAARGWATTGPARVTVRAALVSATAISLSPERIVIGGSPGSCRQPVGARRMGAYPDATRPRHRSFTRHGGRDRKRQQGRPAEPDDPAGGAEELNLRRAAARRG